MGRGSADLIIKRDTALLRAGKILTDVVDKDTRFPFKNFKRSFLQLSLFKQTKVLGEPETKFVIQESISEFKKIVILDIQNLENNVTPRMYSGSVGLYNVKASKKTNSQNFKFDSIKNLKYGEDYTGPIEQITFSMKNTQESVDIINSFIKATFDGYANIPNFAPKSQNNFLNSTPFVVTPSEVTYSKGQVNLSAATLNDLKQFENFTDIFARVTLTKGIKRGFFLVSGDQDGTPKIGPDYKPVTTTETPAEYFDSPITYGILGGQKIYLLSQDSDGPKGKINLADTLYGLEQDDFIGDGKSISTKTYPMVRGDVLMELIDKLFSFVAGHVHPASGSPPDTKSSGNGITVDDITEEIANASQTILNQEIRIN